MRDGLRRELILPFAGGAYLLRYRLEGDTVAIIRAWHGREQRD
jgi:plasmid stabilization system protein ParE